MGILKVKELQSSNGDTVLDINDDGTISVVDAVVILESLFDGGDIAIDYNFDDLIFIL